MRPSAPAACVTQSDAPVAQDSGAAPKSLSERLFSRHAFVLLARNTIASTIVFGIGVLVLWLLVEKGEVNELLAGAASFIVANSLHYFFGRTWIYRGSERAAAAGFAFFLVNSLIGLAVTMAIFAGLLWLGMFYLLARIVTSLFAGLFMFVLNATLNFRAI